MADVSSATASMVLNGKAGAIRPDTIDRVLVAAEALGYRPNALARSLRSQQSHTIGFLSDDVVTTPYAGAMILGAQEVADKHGFALLLANVDSDQEASRHSLEALLDRQVDAVICATMYHRIIEVPAQLTNSPTVLLNARSDDNSVTAVVPDDYAGAEAAMEHLVAMGHRRIGFINDRAGNRRPGFIIDQTSPPAAVEREQAYHDVLRRHGIDRDDTLQTRAPSDPTGGRVAATALLDRPDRPTALFCYNDRMAAGAYVAARHLGLAIPEDLSVVGFDNQVLIAEAIDPPLTTVQLPHLEMGRWAMEQALTLLDENAEPRVRRMPCPLVERESVAPPNHPSADT